MSREILHVVTLRRVKYSDRNSIVTAWSRERGRVTLLVPDSAGRSATRQRALMMVPSIVECAARITPGRDIFPVDSPRSLNTLPSLRSNPLKSMIATVAAELLEAALRDGTSAPDSAMSDFIETILAALDAVNEPRTLTNFLPYFIYRFAGQLGIEPDVSTYTPGAVLDMNGGVFSILPPAHGNFADPDSSKSIAEISGHSLTTLANIGFDSARRRNAIDTLLRYMATHGFSVTDLRSLEVYRSMF